MNQIGEYLLRLENIAFVAGIAAQAVITWWRVGEQQKKLEQICEELVELRGTAHRLEMLERRVFNGGPKT